MNSEKILYWANEIQNDLGTIKDFVYTVDYFNSLGNDLIIYEMPEKTGVIMCFISEDWNGNKYCAEMLMYIKPEYRGKAMSFRAIIKKIQEIAKENECQYVNIGADIGYRDEKTLKIIKKLGYKNETFRRFL